MICAFSFLDRLRKVVVLTAAYVGERFAPGQVGKLQTEFKQRGIKLAALSCNDTESHKA